MLTRTRTPFTWFESRLLAPGTFHRLACVRAGLALAIGFRLLGHQWWQMSGRPEALFQPVPIVAWLPTVPSAAMLIVVQALGVAAAVCVLLGRAPLPSLRVAWVALLFLGALHGSAGKIMHNEVLLLLVTIPVLVSAPAARIGDRARTVACGWPPRTALIVVATVYFLTGVQKLLHSGPEWVFSDNMSWVLYAGVASGQSLAPGFTETVAGAPWLPQLLAGGALLLELTAPVVIAWRLTRPLFILAACGMHASIGVAMGLDYSGWMLAVIVVLFPWDRLGQVTATTRTAARP